MEKHFRDGKGGGRPRKEEVQYAVELAPAGVGVEETELEVGVELFFLTLSSFWGFCALVIYNRAPPPTQRHRGLGVLVILGLFGRAPLSSMYVL